MLLTLSLRCRRCFCGGTVSALCPSPVSRCCLAPFHHPPFSHTRPHNPCPAPLCRTTSSCWCPRCESTHISTRVPACMHKLPPPAMHVHAHARHTHACMHACTPIHTQHSFIRGKLPPSLVFLVHLPFPFCHCPSTPPLPFLSSRRLPHFLTVGFPLSSSASYSIWRGAWGA